MSVEGALSTASWLMPVIAPVLMYALLSNPTGVFMNAFSMVMKTAESTAPRATRHPTSACAYLFLNLSHEYT